MVYLQVFFIVCSWLHPSKYKPQSSIFLYVHQVFKNGNAGLMMRGRASLDFHLTDDVSPLAQSSCAFLFVYVFFLSGGLFSLTFAFCLCRLGLAGVNACSCRYDN